MGPDDIVGILSRWVHVSTVIVLLGGSLFAWVAATGGSGVAWASWRKVVLPAAVLAVLSGLYNLMAKGATPPGYHAIFGVKVLLALHVLGVAVVAANPAMPAAKRKRLLGGVVASGFVIVLLSAHLRWLSR
ncbi:MAG: hypothetical protein R2762_16485 [Bryobacteraceae bacterium]